MVNGSLGETITTVAGGTGLPTSYSGITGNPASLRKPINLGDGGDAIAATLRWPYGLDVDRFLGDFYIADSGNHRIRRIRSENGTLDPTDNIETYAGIGFCAGHSSFGGFEGPYCPLDSPGAEAEDARGNFATLNSPRSVAVDAGNSLEERCSQFAQPACRGPGIFIADTNNHAIRVVFEVLNERLRWERRMSIVAGLGVRGTDKVCVPRAGMTACQNPMGENVNMLVDSFPGRVTYPQGVTVDGDGEAVFANTYSHKIMLVDQSREAMVTVFAGTGVPGYSGDGGRAVFAQLSFPSAVVFRGGDAIILDTGNDRLRLVTKDDRRCDVDYWGAAAHAGPTAETSESITCTSYSDLMGGLGQTIR